MNEAPELVVVRTFTSVPDAHVARSVLDAAGIPTHLADDNIIAADWLYSNAVGGVKLLVPSDRLDEAIAILETPALDAELAPVESIDAPHEKRPEDICPQCGGVQFEPIKRGRRGAALTWLLVGVPLIPVHRAFRCRQCGTTLEARGLHPA
jgi:hypothetical protein